MASNSVTQAEHSETINSDTTLEQTSSESCDTTEESSEAQKIQDSLCHHYLMTTRELQLYWLKEKHKGKPVKLLFEIPSTRIAEDFLSKFVMYQIVIIKTGSFDENKVFIERRYSDFEKLHQNLLKDFKEEMEDVLFPKKILKGNLTEELISKRMLAFKDYLAELYAIECVQKCKKFIDFFINPEIKEAYSCLRGGQYGKAMELFQQVECLQEKLTQHRLILTVPTLCALVVCYKDLEDTERAYDLGMKALALLERHPRHRYYNPLLDTLISMAYKLGKEFVSLQEQLEKGKGQIDGTKLVTLKELVVQECVT
ncbi:sorting nexin-20 [Spea bombifrons]|uniref:sorting nexin-20 n=1 Tax=Spea bombifrons TaxID=233779 RepID=UPI0023497983|nr:sorting nexin-20 [Spea bombifrons]